MTLSMNSKSPLLVCHSHLRWDWVYQRPQHLLSRLARHWPVLVEEEPVVDDRPPGLDLLAVADGVTVLRPHRPAGDSDFDLGAPRRGLRRGGPRAAGRWSAGSIRRCSPTYGDRLGPDQVVVYDCMDELANFAGAPAGLAEAEAGSSSRADVVFTGGRTLHESKRDRNPNVHCFPSAVDAGHFARAPRSRPAAARRPGRPAPADLRLLRRGRRAARLRPDRPAGRRLAGRLGGPGRPDRPRSTRRALPRRPNLHYLGQRSYAELPAYLKGFDVCLMPWALNDATRTISPTKTLEYMAAGKPIVSTPVRDVVRDHGDLVYIADDPARFAEAGPGGPRPPRRSPRRGRAAAGGRALLGRRRRRHVAADRASICRQRGTCPTARSRTGSRPTTPGT